jgi:hypothetical protein
MWREIKDSACIRLRASLRTMKLPVAVISTDNRNLSVSQRNAAHSTTAANGMQPTAQQQPTCRNNQLCLQADNI